VFQNSAQLRTAPPGFGVARVMLDARSRSTKQGVPR
jgi:hypothetical protein